MRHGVSIFGMSLVLAALLVAGCATPGAGTSAKDGSDAAAETSEPNSQGRAPVEQDDASVEQKGDPVDLIGVWDGLLKVQGVEIQIIVKFLTDPTAAAPVATMDIPPQVAYNLPLTNVSATGTQPGDTVHFELATGGPTLIADGEIAGDLTIAGTFSQGAATGEFSITRVSDLAESDLPSDPASQMVPLPGTETEVSIVRAGVTINGTLLIPDDRPDGPSSRIPLVIIHAASGPTDRNGNTPLRPAPNNGVQMLAHELAGNGIATLRYDKRGIAGSAYEGMREEDLVFGDLVDDLLTWVMWAADREDFSGVYLAGHSEGGLAVLGAAGVDRLSAASLGINSELAIQAQDAIAGVICIASPGRTLDALTLEQLERQLGPEAPLFIRSKEIFEAIGAGSEVPEVPPELAALFRRTVQPYLRSVMQYDPVTLAAAMEKPLLIATGVEDIQVPVSDAEALAAARPDASLVIIDGMNHVLKMIPPGDLAANQRSYADPSFELALELVAAISEFVLGER